MYEIHRNSSNVQFISTRPLYQKQLEEKFQSISYHFEDTDINFDDFLNLIVSDEVIIKNIQQISKRLKYKYLVNMRRWK